MAAATKNRGDSFQEYLMKKEAVAASVNIFKNTLLCINANGYTQPGTDAAGVMFSGVAVDAYDNTAGVDGADSVRVRKHGEYEFVYGPGNATQAMKGDEVVILDDQTVTTAAVATNDIACGYISEVISATRVRIFISRHVR